MMGAVSWLLCLVPVARQAWLGKFAVFKECLGDSQFARRPVIDPLIGYKKGV